MKRLRRNPDSSRLSARRITWRGFLYGSLWAAAVAVVAAGAVLALAMFTSVCAIREVRVEGNRFLSTDSVKQISGIEEYENLVTLPVGRIAANLERNSWVAEAGIERHLLHTVTIRIRERKPVAMLYCGGPTYLVDAKGYVTAGAPEDALPELPRIYGGDMRPPEPGSVVSDEKIQEALRVLSSMPESLRGAVQMCNPFDGRGQVFISRDGYNIVYGSSELKDSKNEILSAIILDLKNNARSIAYVDIRVPDAPVIKPL